ncbi:HigA family addiction module antitoxin [Alloscardovia macacae]|uniref:Plasmid maintenance system antidote protein n=1 Tax=Alloscardovia macacae TaxID=1160091 RepID=A0A261F6C6_9BIFI|nr:HigA family addiction module antitoxin [Alloscardovia macacae]OZG54583.1 plasmid maintenance system antidote protein [Alloscardovia macacae]
MPQNKNASTVGEILDEEFLSPLGISRYKLAKAIGVSQSTISDIIHNKRSLTVDLAYRLSKALGTSAEFWLNLQRDYDLLTFDSSKIADITPLVEA